MTGPMKTAFALIVVMIFCLIALVVEVLRDTGRKWPAIIIGAVSVVVLALALWIYPARARDDGRYAQSQLKPWFDSLKSGKGPCCSDADGTALSDVDWESRDGHYRVRIDEKWWDVPDDAVLTQPNLVGRTMVWPVKYRAVGGEIDHIEIRCFMPGPMI